MRGVITWSVLVVLNLVTPIVVASEALNQTSFNSIPTFTWKKMGVVIDNGAPGEPDHVAASSAYVMYDNNTYKIWYSAYDGNNWRGILYATSIDGHTFTKHGAVLNVGVPGDMDDDFVRDPMVLKNSQGLYEMWYTGQKKGVWGWRIFHATSIDGMNWQKHGVVFSKAGLAVAHPDVIVAGDGTYRMWFSEYDKTHWRIRTATSPDGQSWIDQGLCLDVGPQGGPDWLYIYMPSVIVEPDGTNVMFYSDSDGNQYNHVDISYATSSSGMAGTWTKHGVTLDRGQPGEPDDIQAISPSILMGPDGIHRLYYSSYDGQNRKMMLAIEAGPQPPVANIGSDRTIEEGESVVLDVSDSYDPDGYIARYEYDFGDGTYFVYVPPSPGQKPPLIGNQYGDDGFYTITLTVIDDEGISATDSILATVLNVNPAISSTAPSTVFEGGAVTASLEIADQGSDDLFIEIDWGDGSSPNIIVSLNDPSVGPDPYPSPEVNPRHLTKSAHHVYGDNGIFTLTISASDDDGGVSTSSQVIKVMNLPPSLSVPEPPTVSEGQGATLLIDVLDLGSDDISISVDWGDGLSEEEIYYNDGVGPDPPESPLGTHPVSISKTFTHTYGDNGIYGVTVVASDDDGGESAKTVDMEVLNEAPIVNPFGPYTIDEGSSLFIGTKARDAGSDDLTFWWMWELGPSIENTVFNDGIGPDPYPSPHGTYPFSAMDVSSNTYGDNGNYSIVLSVRDDDGAVSNLATYVLVSNVAPSIVSVNYTIFTNAPRTIGYWGHQCEVLAPYGDHTGILTEWVEEISSRSQVFSGITNEVEVCDVLQTGDASEMVEMGRRQLMGVWLNLVSGKLSQEAELNMPNLTSTSTVWDAIMEVENLILSHAERDELERGKNITDNINNGIGIALATVEFTGTATDPGSDDLIFTWDFGDGTMQRNSYLNDGTFPMEVTDFIGHSYFSAGSFTVALTVEDDDGGVCTVTIPIEV
ncbi:MAG: PKD domain-containing protein [Candidatus Thorarchaeota archaeon]